MPALLALLGLLTSAAAAGGGGGGKRAAVIDTVKKIFTPKKTKDEPAAPEAETVAKFAPSKPYKKVFEKPVAKETKEAPEDVVAEKAPAPEPAPKKQVYEQPAPEPTSAPAPVTPVVAEPTPAPAPVAPVIAQPAPAPAPAPAPTPAPAPAPTLVVTPTAPTQSGGGTGGGETDPVSAVSGSYSVDGGRVTTLEVQNSDNVESIRVLDGPSHGNLTVNPDNTLALVMSMDHEFSGNMSMSYEVSYADGSTQVFNDNVNVRPSVQEAGWGQGELYQLETDAQGDLIVETGDNHRDVFISESNSALSINDIAQMAGISPGQVTGEWLAANPQFGGSENMALDLDAGMRVWNEITGPDAPPSSHWLQFERGYEYDGFRGDTLRIAGVEGESALHPVHITSYGTGADAVLRAEVNSGFNIGADNVVISNLEITESADIYHSENIIFDSVSITNDTNGSGNLMGLHVRSSEGFTLRNSEIADVYKTFDVTDGSQASGALIVQTTGILIEGSTFDHNGWSPNYESGNGQEPIMFNHNLYIQSNTRDVTLRDNIIMRGASFGAHVRGGGLVEDNVFLDNNVAVDLLGGVYQGDGPVGNFTLFTDNVITSGGHKQIDGFNGAVARGVDNRGEDTTLLDNIIAHLADPNNAAEQAAKTVQNGALLQQNDGVYYDDTIIHNWVRADGAGTTGVNTDGLNDNTLDATTIQNFTQQLLGDPNASISDLADVLRAQADGQLDNVVDADLIIAYFQAGFGVSVEGRLDAETISFVPNDLGDGIRWDNRLNWETEDLPGLVAGDSVDLGGNYVNFGGNSTVDQLDFGSGGTLNVSSGRLNIEEFMTLGETGASLNISVSGQVWSNGLYQRGAEQSELDLNIDGGRFANTGLFHGNADIDITDGQAILATDDADFILRDGSELEIVGDDASVGFDGGNGGTGVLLLDEGSTLHFDAEGNRLGTIEEFRSGAYGENGPNIQSGVNLGDSTLQLDLSGWTGGASSNTLIEVDEVIGDFSDINVVGLAGNRDAELVVNYDDDTVVLNITAAGAGSGQVNNATTGNEGNAAANADLWAALTEGHGIYADDTAEVEEEEDFLAEVA